MTALLLVIVRQNPNGVGSTVEYSKIGTGDSTELERDLTDRIQAIFDAYLIHLDEESRKPKNDGRLLL